MAQTHSSIAIDSERELNRLVGDDATATLESDPNFRDTDPTEHASSQNLALEAEEEEDAEEEPEDEEDAEDEEEEEEDEEEATDRVTDAALRLHAALTSGVCHPAFAARM